MEKRKKISFYIYPKKKKTITLIKAPMAHKTFSQDQFIYKYYIISLTIKLNNIKNTSINEYLLIFFKKYILLKFIGTNFFFLKKISIKLFCLDNKYFLIKK